MTPGPSRSFQCWRSPLARDKILSDPRCALICREREGHKLIRRFRAMGSAATEYWCRLSSAQRHALVRSMQRDSIRDSESGANIPDSIDDGCVPCRRRCVPDVISPPEVFISPIMEADQQRHPLDSK
jgi:hypothetical protein